MFSFLTTLSNKLKYSLIHPQWISNSQHLKRLKSLSEINRSLILDIGSGDCEIERFISHNNSLVKIDYPNTNQRYINKPDVFSDASALPIKSESIDIVFIFEVLEHLKNQHQAITEIYRVLKPSGIIYASVPFAYPLHDMPFDFRRYTPNGLTNLLEKNNFSPLSSKNYPSHWATLLYLRNMHYLQLFKKVYSVSIMASYILLPFIFLLCFINNLLASFNLRSKESDTLFLGTFIKAIKDS